MCGPWQLVSRVTSVREHLATRFVLPTRRQLVAVNNGLEFPFVTSLAIDSD